MDHQHDDSTGGGRPPPRKELQGPRPTPLKVRKESHKIKKPPVAPPAVSAAVQPYQQPPPQPPRQPVIIYTVSPKVIHTHPSEFMTLVQRLTGPDATSSSTSSSSSSSSSSTSFQYPTTSSSIVGSSYHHVSGGISPAARLASIEKTKISLEGKKFVGTSGVMGGEVMEKIGGDSKTNGGGEGEGGGLEGVERTVFFPGILSPGPGSLPPISPNLFSSFFQDPSPVQHGNIMRNYIEGNNFNIMPSPFSTNNLISPSTMFSPSSLELLHHILDN